MIKKDYQQSKVQQIQPSSSKKSELSNFPLKEVESNLTFFKVAISSWGLLGVVTLIANALQRLIPVALQPLIQKDLTIGQGVIYLLWTIYLLYVEGYKGFHLAFSPRVVRRSLTITDKPTFLKCLLAGPYCMGLFGATKKRMILSWGMMAGVFALVKIVKLLPYPWRSIVDGGVVCGLAFGTLSIFYHYIWALLGHLPSIDPDLPIDQDSENNKEQ